MTKASTVAIMAAAPQGAPTNLSLPPAAPSAQSKAVEPRRKIVVFSLDDQHYGVDIKSVREIRMAQTITYIPGAPKHICGVINLRGSIVPVCDLRARIGHGETVLSRSHRIVIAMVGGNPVGLLVDEVLDIATVAESEISPLPRGRDSEDAPRFTGIVSTSQGEMTILVDLDHLVDPDARSARSSS